MRPRFDVCFVGLKCYDQLAGAAVPRYLGGIEKLLAALARGLAQRGNRVAFITYDHGQADGESLGGVFIFKSFRPDEGLPGLRFLHPRTTGLWAAMKRVNAAVYLQMGAGDETGRVALGCRLLFRQKRGFAFCVASDADCNPGLLRSKPVRERGLYRLGIRFADIVISQTVAQQNKLLASFGLRSEVVPMPLPGLQAWDTGTNADTHSGRKRILWVGRITPVKRLEWLLDVAARCPEFEFDVVGTPNRESDYSREMMARSAGMQNVTMHGRVSDDKLMRLYRQAFILCCTSVVEGFPTTFLEAWSRGLPVVTSFDPDGIVALNGVGLVAVSLDQMVSSIRDLSHSPDQWNRIARKAAAYFGENYTFQSVVPRFDGLLSRIAP